MHVDLKLSNILKISGILVIQDIGVHVTIICMKIRYLIKKAKTQQNDRQAFPFLFNSQLLECLCQCSIFLGIVEQITS